VSERKRTLILVRHGESTWNLENRFTGWHDVPLTEKGEAEARDAGRLLREARVIPDVVHTSVLLRAIQTAEALLAEMELAWLPVKRSWRLNERHYGALQGLNKRETADQYGEEQVKLWRRSYSVRPPEMSADDERHARFDPRYKDLPDELIPATESLADVLARVLPYWYDALVPDLAAGAATLVVAHGNSLRALVKHLEQLSEREVVELNLPTGIPRVYELDAHWQPASARYLGDPAQVAARAEAVARQASRQGGG
jgi:2,3-bisphosphoglycerate-dependent phosphoglycerate mutase